MTSTTLSCIEDELRLLKARIAAQEVILSGTNKMCQLYHDALYRIAFDAENPVAIAKEAFLKASELR